MPKPRNRARSRAGLGLLSAGSRDEDPLAGLANLFDIGIVFALGFLVALLSALKLADVLAPEGTVTITKERDDGFEVIVRERDQTTVRRLTRTPGSGDGTRLGVAHRLKDGRVVYVPEAGKDGGGGE